MAYLRPSLQPVQGNKASLTVPPGWDIVITGLSKEDYQQVVLVEHTFFDTTTSKKLVAQRGSRNRPMINQDVGTTSIVIKAQDENIDISFSFYFSQNSEIIKRSVNQLEGFRSRSVTPVVENRPANVTEAEQADYMTVTLVAHNSNPNDPTGDLEVTVQMDYTLPEPEPETGTRGISEQAQAAVEAFLDRYRRPDGTYPTPPPPHVSPAGFEALPVGIIGAGVSGLYIAMMLESLGIKYEIMKGSERVGGRLYTHYFPKNQGKYQYYDVGAMRYPNTTFMKRTFNLVSRLNMTNKFITYLRKNDNAFLCYNGVSMTKEEAAAKPRSEDMFRVSRANGGNIPPEFLDKGTDQVWEALSPLRQLFVDYPFDEAQKKLMDYDGYSVRSYLTLVKHFPTDVVNWFETVEARTGLFDQALTETILASLVFNDPNFKDKQIDWYCFDGGSEVLHKEMMKTLSVKPVLYQRATVIEETDGGHTITVTFDGRRHPNPAQQIETKRRYSNVITTMSFACLRMVDLTNAGLNYGQANAIRDLIYTPSIKVGIQFKRPWWEDLGIVGGQSSTDLPIRDVVYPSYGPDDSHADAGERSNCMIASYNGMQDSQRLGGLMKGHDTPEERVLLDLIMRNLAQLHRVPVSELWELYEDYYPWDFHRDAFQLGAFCQFGPGQFKYVYPYITQPASSKQRLHFAGDATSCFHGWVAGALNSAWRAVFGMLVAHPELNPDKNVDIIAKFTSMWGDSEEWATEVLTKVVDFGRLSPNAQ